MALLLFGKPASGLSPFELLQAAQALAELTGSTGRRRHARQAARRAGARPAVDQFGRRQSPNRRHRVEAGRYVAPGVYVGARQGASADSSRGVVEIEVLDHIKIEGDIGADSNGRVGVKIEWDY